MTRCPHDAKATPDFHQPSTEPIDALSEPTLRKLAAYHVPLLISGESGTGKEVLARRVHELSERADAPFVAVNCGAIPASLVESQLFGHVRGAFTSAESGAQGFLRAADGGTVLLDEVGELSPAAQVALLRCLEQREVVPVGAAEPVPVDIRVMAATHRDLHALQARFEFRADLFYRLNVMHLTQQPLRARRRDDIHQLIEHFTQRVAAMHEEPIKQLSETAIDALLRYQWPGNVRELANAIEHGFVMAEGDTIHFEALPQAVRDSVTGGESGSHADDLVESERALLQQALETTRGDKSQAARRLGLQRQTLHRLLDRLDVQRPVSG